MLGGRPAPNAIRSALPRATPRMAGSNVFPNVVLDTELNDG